MIARIFYHIKTSLSRTFLILSEPFSHNFFPMTFFHDFFVWGFGCGAFCGSLNMLSHPPAFVKLFFPFFPCLLNLPDLFLFSTADGGNLFPGFPHALHFVLPTRPNITSGVKYNRKQRVCFILRTAFGTGICPHTHKIVKTAINSNFLPKDY